MLTALGKYLRKARIDMNSSLRDMAKAVEISPAYLSAIETGKRDVRDELVERFASYLKANTAEEKNELYTLAAQSNSELVISMKEQGDIQKETVTLLARHMNEVDEETLLNIQKLVTRDSNMKR